MSERKTPNAGFLMLESFVNETEGYTFEEFEPFEPCTSDLGWLFQYYQREYGGCRGYVYIGDGVPVGWIFSRKERYSDSKTETYVRTVWVSLVNEFGGYVDLREIRKVQR